MKSFLTTIFCLVATLSLPLNLTAQDLQDGLRAWYPLDGDGSDKTLFENHGEIFGNVEKVTDRNAVEEGALMFDSEFKACIGVPALITWPGAFTVNVFLNGDAFEWTGGQLEETFVVLEQQLDFSMSVKRIDEESLVFQAELSSGEGAQSMHRVADAMYVDDFIGRWRMLTAVYDGTELRLYVDAQFVKSLIIPVQPDYIAELTAIGSSVDRRNGFDGAIDDVRIYDRVLSEAEMQALMETDEVSILRDRELFDGRAIVDFNGNCVMDADDMSFQGRLIHIMPKDRYYRTDNSGRWTAVLDAGTYTARIEPIAKYNELCAPGRGAREFVVDENLEVAQSLDFASKPDDRFCEVAVSIAGARPRPGFEFTFTAQVVNTGLCPWSGWVHVIVDPRATLNSVSPEHDVYFDDVYSFRVEDLPRGHVLDFVFNMTLDTRAELGTEWCSSVRAEKDGKGDEILRADYDEDCVSIRGSYDPNDIVVYPGPQIADVMTDLTYRIRFQNTGTAPAERVIVKQQLPSDLRIGSMIQGIVSHDYEFHIDKNRMATWTFNDIMLPDSSSDLEGSNGYIKFRVRMNEDTQRGTEVLTDASIYFDFNDPIITNMADVELAEIVTSNDDPAPVLELNSLFPNPASDVVVINLNVAAAVSVEVVDILGGVLKSLEFQNQSQLRVDVSDLAEGTYFVRVRSGDVLRPYSFQVRR